MPYPKTLTAADYDHPGALDAFTAWFLTWQDWILSFLAIVFVAGILTT